MSALARFLPRARFQRSASTLLLGVHGGGRLDKATLHAASAAMKVGGGVDVLLTGAKAADAAAEASKIDGVEKVFVGADASSDQHATLVQGLHAKHGYSHIFAPAVAECKDVLPRAAALMDLQPISDILEVKDADTYVRPMYAGNALATVKSKDATKVVTVRTTAFPPHSTGAGTAAVENVDVTGEALSECVDVRSAQSDKPQLTSASRVVAGGRALKSAENFEQVLDPLCTKLGAAVGASRAAVDSGYAPNEQQIGQTGKVVAPDLYIAVGISGAIQHLAGMKDSKTIVAINKDADAPIFQVADVGLVADLFDAVPELTGKL